MSKTASAFANGKAFIPFITCGDPDGDKTVEYVLAAADAGADMIEIGIPFSDPTAEGPVIQMADAIALKDGMTVKGCFEVVRRIRELRPELPLAFMTYVNPVFKYKGRDGSGTEPYVPFFEECREAGIDALILADVPFEEQKEVLDVSDRYDVDLISMVSPTSENRIREIAKHPRGFIYVVSSMGVTGVRTDFQYDTISHMVSIIRETNPEAKCAVGFGISTPETAEQMARISDGAIVGSAILRKIHAGASPQDVYDYVKAMKDGVRRADE